MTDSSEYRVVSSRDGTEAAWADVQSPTTRVARVVRQALEHRQ
jgi:hypothetical protein